VDLAAADSRAIDGRVLTLAPSGCTYRRTFVLYDKETRTLWYPYEEGLMGIGGVYFQGWLPKVAAADTTWQDWEKKYPSSKIIQ